MPQLIEKGYLYIAQPPLYQVKRGEKALYLKDDHAMEEYLLDNVLNTATYNTTNGTRAGGDLRDIAVKARTASNSINAISRSTSHAEVIEQVAIADGFNPNIVNDTDLIIVKATEIAKRLDNLADNLSKGWTGTADSDGYTFQRTLRGVPQIVRVPCNIITSREALKLHTLADALMDGFATTSTLVLKAGNFPITGPVAMMTAINEQGKKGINVQRYKGLGEMNPDQLWETTLDPDARTLLQVKVNHVDEANEVFETLMGDIVEPRRDFIQKNALNVSNLDV